jgi:lysophospholipase L1-like esterase
MGARLKPPLAAFLLIAFLIVHPIGRAQAEEAPVYIAIGDSIAFGVGATNPAAEGYVGLAHFEFTQDEAYSDPELELVNVSVPGATSADLLLPENQLDQALEEIERRGEGGGSVALISVGIGANDLLALGRTGSPCLANTSSTACQDALASMLSDLDSNLRETLLELRRAAPDARIYVVDVYNPYSGTGDPLEIIASAGIQQVNGVIKTASADPAADATLVPVYELFQGRGSQWIASDGLHPNDDGHRVLAEALMAAVEERAVVIPPDLAAVPTDVPVPVNGGNSPPVAGSDDGTFPWTLAVAVPLAFLAGALVSAAFFVLRGRPA